jgi:tetratricopeptide (TPR) repeat protein
MRAPSLITVVAFASLVASPAGASFGGGSKPESPPPANPTESTQSLTGPRQEAERLYADAYDDVTKAKQDLADGKTKNAEKKLRRALDRGQRAVELDPKYHEAWNLVGYSARKLRDYDRALAAYDKCLALKPDYAPAHEYLGEAYLELANPKKAREQLAWLEHSATGAADAKDLRTAILAYEAAHPAAPDSSGAAPAPRADSTGGAHGGE